jgi:hypothetical protein
VGEVVLVVVVGGGMEWGWIGTRPPQTCWAMPETFSTVEFLNMRISKSMQPKFDSTLSLVTCAPFVALARFGSLPTENMPSCTQDHTHAVVSKLGVGLLYGVLQ